MSKETIQMDLALPVTDQDHIEGSEKAVVTLVEYGDYECPFTAGARPFIRELENQFGNDLRFVFRNFPLIGKYWNAERAAEAAEAAGMQGKYWEMHDFPMKHYSNLSADTLAQAAAYLNLDEARFHREVTQHAYRERVRQDISSGRRSGVNGTPTLFINGVIVDGKDDLETLPVRIQEAIDTYSGTKRKR